MQATQPETEPKQNVVPIPNCNMLDRLFALAIDAFCIAALIWVATRAFGTAWPGNDTSVPGSLFGPGGVIYGRSITSGNSTSTSYWTIALSPLWQGILVFLYFTLLEAFFGTTLGKAIMGLCVVSQVDEHTYTRLTLRAAVLRNLLRFVDAAGTYIVGLIVVLCSPRRRRLGDMVARTLAVNAEDVPYARPTRKQTTPGLQVVAALLLAFLLTCSLFTYFGSARLVAQNAIITQPDTYFAPDMPYQNVQIRSYTLGQANWGQDRQGETTITYPISFFAASTVNQVGSYPTDPPVTRMHECQGSITLTWRWSALAWELGTYDGSCRDV